jgi:1,2-phenylacetyl-CoA epoxidase catalytic subunit
VNDSEAPLFEFVLRLGDDALVLGQRIAAWTGHAPIVEEDLALTNVALDLIGHARLWLTLAGTIEGAGRDEDALAYFRDAHDFGTPCSWNVRTEILRTRSRVNFSSIRGTIFYYSA